MEENHYIKMQKQDSIKIQLSETEVSLLKQTIKNKLIRLVTNGVEIDDKVILADYFSLHFLQEDDSLSELSKTYLTIEADYTLSKLSSTTYYKFNVFADTKPYIIPTDGNALLWPFVEIATEHSTLRKIEVYHSSNQEFEEKIEFDCGLLFYMNNGSKILFYALQQARGGVCYVTDDNEIKSSIAEWPLRFVIE